MKIGLVIPSHSRSDILQNVLAQLMLQRQVPDYVVLSAVDVSDLPKTSHYEANIRTILGSPGLACQRNRGMACLTGLVDVIVFLDDDFLVGRDYFLNLKTIFERDNSIVGVTGHVIADGASSKGLAFDEGLILLEKYAKGTKPCPSAREVTGTYGCNMAFRTSAIGALRFDERLPLYGWQEDLDFSGALRGTGRIVQTNRIWGVHLGTKRGKGSEVRLGYSQIINPAYIVHKGNMSLAFASQLVMRNFIANLVKSICPENYIDRRGRLRGNLLGLLHLMSGRLTPEYILELE
jgi:GT2 family glycosyltransferase